MPRISHYVKDNFKTAPFKDSFHQDLLLDTKLHKISSEAWGTQAGKLLGGKEPGGAD